MKKIAIVLLIVIAYANTIPYVVHHKSMRQKGLGLIELSMILVMAPAIAGFLSTFDIDNGIHLTNHEGDKK